MKRILVALMAAFVASAVFAKVPIQQGFESASGPSDAGFVPSVGAEDDSKVVTYASAKPSNSLAPYPFAGDDADASFGSKYLSIDTGDSTLWRANSTTGNVYFDMVAQFQPVTETSVALSDDAKFAVYLDSNSNVVVVAGNGVYPATVTNANVTATKLDPGAWARVTIAAENNAFSVRINGTLVSSSGTSSFPFLKSGDITSVGFSGTGALDDFVARTTDPYYSGTGAATIGSGNDCEKYDSLADALADADGATVTLQSDADAIATPLAVGESYSIALSGHTFGGFTVASGAVMSKSISGGVTTYRALSDAKPLAVWNADFTSEAMTRNGFTFDPRGQTISNGKITIVGDETKYAATIWSAAGSSVGSNVVAAIVRFADIPNKTSGNWNLLLGAATTGFSSGGQSNAGLLGQQGGGYFGAHTGSPAYQENTLEPYSLDTSSGNKYDIGFMRSYGATSGNGVYGYVDGVKKYYNTTTFYNNKNYGLTIGGFFNLGSSSNGKYRPGGATVSFAALFLTDSILNDSSFEAWSLGDMTPVTIADGETISSSTVTSSDSGINLSGGTVTVSGEVSAKAIFVQGDTTLNMTAGVDKLVLSRLLYIVDGATLTLNVSNPSDYVAGTDNTKELISGTLYVSGSMVSAGTMGTVDVGRAFIVADSNDGSIKWVYKPMPVWSNGSWSRTPTESDTEIIIDSSYGATYNAGGAYTAVYVQGTGTLPIGANGLTATTLDVASGATINMANVTTTTITGGGVVVFDGAVPSDSTIFDSSWTGTCWVKNIPQSGDTQIKPNSWGNANSVLRVTNVTGWIAEGSTIITPIEVVDEDSTPALTLFYTTSPSSTIVFNELRGNGTFKTAGTAWPTIIHRIQAWDSFTGSLDIDRGRVVFGTGSFSVWRCICVGADKSVEVPSGKTWYAYNGFGVDSGATLTVKGNISYGGASDPQVTDAIIGSGTVVFDGEAPSPTGSKWWTTSGWNGTVQIKGILDVVGTTNYSGTYLDFNAYGNASSEVEINNITGWLASYTCDVPLKITGTFTYNNGLSGAANVFKVKVLRGTGKIYGITAGTTQPFQITDDWSEFAGAIQLKNSTKVVVFGENMPSTIIGGGIYINNGKEVEIKSSYNWYSEGKGFVIDGTLKAGSRAKWGDETAMVINSTGMLELGSSDSNDMKGKNLSNITGTGTIHFVGNNWQSLPNSSNMFADTLAVSNDCSGGVAIVYDTTIGTLSGTGNFRCDFDSTSSVDRELTVKQAANSTWSGRPRTAGTHLVRVNVAAADGATEKTLTYSGTTMTENMPLSIAANGSFNLTGMWVGNVTVAGSIGGTGTLTGDLTLSNGATLIVDDVSHPLAVTGDITATGTINVKLPEGTTSVSQNIISATGTVSSSATFKVYVGESLRSNMKVKSVTGGLKIVTTGSIISYF